MSIVQQVIVNHIPLRSQPYFESPFLNKTFYFSQKVVGTHIIYYQHDFNYLETSWNHQKAYIPTQYLRPYHPNSLPLDYVPFDLKPIPPQFTYNHQTILLRNDALQQLLKLLKSAQSHQINLKIRSGYQSIKKLTKKYQNYYKISFPHTNFEKPYHSPYVLGHVVDISSPEIHCQKSPSFYFTKAFQWLKFNSWKFNFYSYTPIHYLTSNSPWKPWQLFYQPICLKKNIIKKYIQSHIQIPKQLNIKPLNQNPPILPKKYKTSNHQFVYILLHDHQETPKSTAQYALKYYGGSLYQILNKNQKNLKIHTQNPLSSDDPDIILINSKLKNIIYPPNPQNPNPYIVNQTNQKIQKINQSILNQLVNPKNQKNFISIQTINRFSPLSIQSFKNNPCFTVYHNPNQNQKNFFYVLYQSQFSFFKNKKYNVAWLKNTPINQHHSLHTAMAHSKKQYLSIHVAEGFLYMALEMLDLSVYYFNYIKNLKPNYPI